VRRGQVRLIQAAAYWQEGEDAASALSKRVEKVEKRAKSASPQRGRKSKAG
jgi:hypothetical protein